MLEILKKDSLATFMFIGNPDENGTHNNTRRYRLYCRLVSNKISDKYFKHIRTPKYSLYILANRNILADKPFFTEELLENFVTRFIVEEPEHDIQL